MSSTDEEPFSLARLMVRADTSSAQLASWLTAEKRHVAVGGERIRTRLRRLHRRVRALTFGRPASDIQ
jgi:hypothetical protein